MSQPTATAVAPATPPAPEPAPARALMSRRGAGDTPSRMRLVSAALVVVGLLVGLVAAQSFWSAQGALARADANAAQLVRLQDIQTALVRADATATNAFLVGGLEPAEQRADYDDAVERASRQLTFAARAQAADGEALAELSTLVSDYTGGVVQARTINRQGLPLGAQYLREASASLRADALPVLESLTQANEARVATEFTTARQARALAIGAGVVGLLLVAGALWWLARRTHRYLNVPVLGAGLVVLGLLVVSAIVLGSVGAAVASVRDGSYATARAVAGARIAAFDAKSNESLTLISRGSGAAFEEAWVASAAITSDTFAETAVDLAPSWDAYTTLHADIRALDDGGDWDAAVAAATSRADGSANAAFDAFDAASAERLTAAGDETSSALRSAESGLTLGAWLSVLAGILAAALAWWGISQRVEEYR
ncbi:hypothetical protein [Pengzhenrongella sicca]|uniref:Chemotaxis methyl-accepting receptor HlyB-like 4HB MCP domain-containing protein n=1 Tax=Pengzhenrongella sicca TaxID=2819238 RepID=A0A8A4ZIJ6_9MICO|nr:hypothetical protein [Pengzhenrongella sicca]QTE30833.1 hypothetical protein J4E96_07860 [Pengzhenrongella sicca]